MDFWQLFQTLIATIVGGCIVIAANWITVREERKKAAQEWYVQTYITEGIDPLLSYFLSLEMHMLDGWEASFMQLPEVAPMPIEALAKMRVVLGVDEFGLIIGVVHAALNSKNGSIRNAAHNAICDSRDVLQKARGDILHMISKEVRDKSYQVNLPGIYKEVDHIFQRCIDKVAKLTEQTVP